MDGLRTDVTDIPEPASVEALEKFANEVLEELYAEENITVEKKRRLFEMMHLKVILHPEGNVGIDGWFNVAEHEGLSSLPSGNYVRLLRPIRVRA